MIIQRKESWRESLKNLSYGADGNETTPFRRLIQKMPGNNFLKCNKIAQKVRMNEAAKSAETRGVEILHYEAKCIPTIH